MSESVACSSSGVREHRMQLVSDPSRLAELNCQARSALGIEFPIEYVRRSFSLGLFNGAGCVVGGAMILVDPPFRSLDSIPRDASKLAADQLGNLSDVAEINGVWIDPSIKSPMTSLVFWPELFQRLLESGRSRFLFTFDQSNSSMAAIARWVDPQIVYSGRTLKLPGMQRESNETIAILEKGKIAKLVSQLTRIPRKTPSVGIYERHGDCGHANGQE